MMPLVVGTFLAVGALAFVLYPIFRAASGGRVARPGRAAGDAPGAVEHQSAIDALREIEFDRATGKLSDDDYAVLRARYTSEAVIEMRDSDAAARAAASGGSVESASLDAAEALISRFRSATVSCPACGPRPEPDAVYCSNCGRFLPGACKHCGAAISEPGAKYCSSCGASLAA